MVPHRGREERFAVFLHELFPLGSDREGLALVPHLLGTQKPQINQDNGEAERREFPRPREAVGHLVVRVTREIPRQRRGILKPIACRLDPRRDSLVIHLAISGRVGGEPFADTLVDELRIVRLGLDKEKAWLVLNCAGACDVEVGRPRVGAVCLQPPFTQFPANSRIDQSRCPIQLRFLKVIEALGHPAAAG